MLLPVLTAAAPRDLWAPDEPRYGLVARTMLDEGHWLVPRINGVAYAEKAPLVHWTMAASGAVLGMTPLAARLPCALLAALAVLMTYRLARRWWGDPDLAVTAALLLSATGLALWNMPRAALDFPMIACSLVALEAGTVVAARGSTPAALLMGVALGLALLAKGPHALYVPVAALAGGCVGAGRARRLLDVRWLLALSVAALVVAAWLVPALAAAGDEPAYNSTLTFRDRLLGQITSRISGENEPHEAPWWYLVPLLAGFALPWTPLWAAALPRAVRARAADAADRFGLGAAAAGLLVPLVLLSVPTSKREVYVLQLLPCAAMLAAWTVHREARSRGGVHALRAVVAVLAAVAVGSFALPFVARADLLPARDTDRDVLATLAQGSVPFALGAVGALAAAGAAGAWALRSRPSGAVRAAAVAVAAAAVVVFHAVVPAFDPWKSFAWAAAEGERAAPGAPLASAGFADASVLWGFRRDRLLQLGNRHEAAAAELLAPGAPQRLLLAKAKHWREGIERAAPAQRAVLERARVLWERPIGGTRFVLVTNAPPP
jgi:4-amino-4-deoxy-L-arabinose transferase-like glycosyltransferase